MPSALRLAMPRWSIASCDDDDYVAVCRESLSLYWKDYPGLYSRAQDGMGQRVLVKDVALQSGCVQLLTELQEDQKSSPKILNFLFLTSSLLVHRFLGILRIRFVTSKNRIHLISTTCGAP